MSRGLNCCARTAQRLLCSPAENRDWFAATIGGLGLTGLITWAEFRLRRVDNSMIEMESVKFGNLDEFFEVSAESDRDFEYTVAWLDCTASGDALGRGIFMRGNHAGPEIKTFEPHRPPRVHVPCDLPDFAMNHFTLRAFNALYYARQRKQRVHRLVHYDPFFYPLDAAGEWNRIYGRRGFFQYQFVIPSEANHRRRPARAGRHRGVGTGFVSGRAENIRRDEITGTAFVSAAGGYAGAGLSEFGRRDVWLAG